MNDALAVAEIMPTAPPTIPAQALSIFNDAAAFRQAAEMATFLAKSTLVPKDYQNNPSNTMIAIDIANRIGASPLMVMQNLCIVHGRPSWSSQFVISVINACGRFSNLRFEFAGQGDSRECKAVARDRNGDVLEGPAASIAMAKAEGWLTRAGSKWQSMPELMIRYRAASFFGRLYCPDILNGMYTADEVADFAPPEPRAPVAEREPGDDNLLQSGTRQSIEAALKALGRTWDADTIALAAQAVKHELAADMPLADLTNTDGVKLLSALSAAIAKKAKGGA